MYYEFMALNGKSERLKVPEDIAKEFSEGATSMEISDGIPEIIYSGRYYDKFISQSVAEFLIDVHLTRYYEGPRNFYDEMEIDDIVVCVLGSRIAGRTHTNMFAYRKKEKD